MTEENIILNWRENPVQPPMTLSESSDSELHSLHFSGNVIVCGSNQMIYVWSAVNGRVSVYSIIQLN